MSDNEKLDELIKELPRLSQRSDRALDTLIASTLSYGMNHDTDKWMPCREKMLAAITDVWNRVAELERR